MTEDKVTDNENIDQEYIAVAQYIRNKRDKFNRFETSKTAANNKYNIKATSTDSNLETGDNTFCDSLFDFMHNDNGNISETDKIRNFIT